MHISLLLYASNMANPSILGPEIALLSAYVMIYELCVYMNHRNLEIISFTHLSFWMRNLRPREGKWVSWSHLTALGHISDEDPPPVGFTFFVCMNVLQMRRHMCQMFIPKQNTCQKWLHFSSTLKLVLLTNVFHVYLTKYSYIEWIEIISICFFVPFLF